MDNTKDFGVLISDDDYDHHTHVLISDDDYDYHMNLIKKMSPKKRNQYKSHLSDKWGQRSKLIFKDGDLLNYSILEKKFVPVAPMGVIFQMVLSEGSTITDVSNVGLRVFLGEDASTVIEESIQENHTGNHTGRVNHRTTIHSGRHFAGF